MYDTRLFSREAYKIAHNNAQLTLRFAGRWKENRDVFGEGSPEARKSWSVFKDQYDHGLNEINLLKTHAQWEEEWDDFSSLHPALARAAEPFGEVVKAFGKDFVYAEPEARDESACDRLAAATNALGKALDVAEESWIPAAKAVRLSEHLGHRVAFETMKQKAKSGAFPTREAQAPGKAQYEVEAGRFFCWLMREFGADIDKKLEEGKPKKPAK